MPVYWFALFLGILSLWLISPISAGVQGLSITGDFIFSIFGVSEIVRFWGISSSMLYPGNTPLCTVAVEMLLYASYPLFLLIYKRYGAIVLALFGLFLYTGVVIGRMTDIAENVPNYLHGTYFEFVIYWIIGACSAGIYSAQNNNQTGVRTRPIAILAVFTYMIYVLMTNFIHIKGLHVITTLLLAITTGGSLIVMLRAETIYSVKISGLVRFMAILGERSYSLYVIHTPIIFTTLWLLNTYTSLHVLFYPLLTLSMVFITTELLFRLIERPSHIYAKRFKKAI